MSQGFSLIELLIVLALIAILSSFIYPNYQTYVIRTHRLEGEVALLDLANKMEQFYSVHHSYQHAEKELLTAAPKFSNHYTLSILEATDNTFTLQVILNNINNAPCKILSLNSLGVKSPMNCWIKNIL